MRSFVLLLSIFIYFISCNGVVYSVHKCGGKEISRTLLKSHSPGCGGSQCESEGCCENEVHLIKLKDDQSFNTSIVLDGISMDWMLPPSAPIFSTFNTQLSWSKGQEIVEPPPILHPKVPIFLLNRQLII